MSSARSRNRKSQNIHSLPLQRLGPAVAAFARLTTSRPPEIFRPEAAQILRQHTENRGEPASPPHTPPSRFPPLPPPPPCLHPEFPDPPLPPEPSPRTSPPNHLSSSLIRVYLCPSVAAFPLLGSRPWLILYSIYSVDYESSTNRNSLYAPPNRFNLDFQRTVQSGFFARLMTVFLPVFCFIQ